MDDFYRRQGDDALDSVDDYRRQVSELGFALVPNVVSVERIEMLIEVLEQAQVATRSRRRETYAARNLLELPEVARLTGSPELRSLVESALGKNALPVRGILFDKVPSANWRVGWHQDQIIPVAERKETPGFTAWSIKQNVPHVRPPATVLERMLTVRLHLDDCGPENGALRVIAGSHQRGLLDSEAIERIVGNATPTICEAKRGDVLLMRPLLLHASAPATSPSHRRVIHLEHASDPLPGGLEWPRPTTL